MWDGPNAGLGDFKFAPGTGGDAGEEDDTAPLDDPREYDVWDGPKAGLGADFKFKPGKGDSDGG